MKNIEILFCFFQLIIFTTGDDHEIGKVELTKSHKHLTRHHNADARIDKANLVYCNDDACELITAFKIADNNTISCLKLYIGIEFDIEMLNLNKSGIEKVQVHAYLNNEKTEHAFNVLMNEQKKSDSCIRLKK